MRGAICRDEFINVRWRALRAYSAQSAPTNSESGCVTPLSEENAHFFRCKKKARKTTSAQKSRFISYRRR